MAVRRTSVLEQLKDLLGSPNRWLRKEAAEIAYSLLGGKDLYVKFRKPGVFYHARWKANIFYYGKMLLFSSQLNYSTEFVSKLNRFMQFVAMLYIVPWLRSPLTLEAAAVDLALHKDLIRFTILDRAVGNAARDVLDRHMWYLTPELAVFELFLNSFSIQDEEDAAPKSYCTHPTCGRESRSSYRPSRWRPVWLTS